MILTTAANPDITAKSTTARTGLMAGRPDAIRLLLYHLRRSYDADVVAITIRDVPGAVRDELAARAARAGQSLQEYLRGLLIATADKPVVGDVIARARARVDATGTRLDIGDILAAKDADRR